MSYTLGTCVPNLPAKFGNRQDLNTLADGSKSITALMQSLQELTETYEFEELKYQTPIPPATTLALTASDPIVPISDLLATIPANTAFPQFQNQNVVDITDIYTFWMWFSAQVNQAGRTLEYRRITTIDMYTFGVTSLSQTSFGVAPPVYYSRFGNVLQVGPSPDQNYDFFVRMKLRHPFPVNGLTTFSPANLTSNLTAGVVTSVTVNSGGTGYLPSKTDIPVVFDASPTGAIATGTATSNASGIITGITVTNGASGYVAPPSVNTAAIAAQVVFAPDSWQEILEYSAVLRLALWEGASEYVAMFKAILFGDPKQPTKVGLVQARLPQMQRDEMHNSRALSLRVNSYTFAR
jgi:hypothetical protein